MIIASNEEQLVIFDRSVLMQLLASRCMKALSQHSSVKKNSQPNGSHGGTSGINEGLHAVKIDH